MMRRHPCLASLVVSTLDHPELMIDALGAEFLLSQYTGNSFPSGVKL